MIRVPAALLALVVAAPLAALAQPACRPTAPDALGPFYVPGAPARTATGRGLAVTGVVRSAAGCAPLAGATLEWWSADAAGDYGAAHRATQRADAEGRYRYETTFPGRYPGRPPHLHVVSVAPIFGEAIRCNYLHKSIGDLFVYGVPDVEREE